MKYASLLPIVALAIISPTLASVFVYYPLTVTIAPSTPGVVFQKGSNAGESDIGTEKTITVSITDNGTSASVEIHPTYQKNYYKDVLRIVNNDDNAMNVYLIFRSRSGGLPSNLSTVVLLLVYEGTTKKANTNIVSQELNTPVQIGTINKGGEWQIDFYVYIPGTSTITTGQSYTVTMDLVYTPSTTETPPTNPELGR